MIKTNTFKKKPQLVAGLAFLLQQFVPCSGAFAMSDEEDDLSGSEDAGRLSRQLNVSTSTRGEEKSTSTSTTTTTSSSSIRPFGGETAESEASEPLVAVSTTGSLIFKSTLPLPEELLTSQEEML